MPDPSGCPGCGVPLATDGGPCPACASRAGGLRSADGTPTRDPRAGSPPNGEAALETLAWSIGPVPPVTLRETLADSDCSTLPLRPGPAGWGDADGMGRYELLGEIARGGMGVVFKGRDPDLGRDLAIKVLLDSHEEKADLIRRFVEEARIGGQLQHPGVAPVYELGVFADARPYFTMKLVRGRTLAALLRDRGGPAAELPRFLAIFQQVCQTMAYAHSRGVIHRDLKPSNVMVGGFGEVQVMDWGLAKVLSKKGDDEGGARSDPTDGGEIHLARGGSAADASMAGTVLGTPAYMPPEQARGDVGAVDERADVFGLGSILCEILTGRPAYTGTAAPEAFRKALRGDTAEAAARLDASGAEADLLALARDCLAVEPADRPRDAGEVAVRVTAYLAGVQDRLRAAELARVAAETRAEEQEERRVLADQLATEERRKRRAILALAASVLLTMTLGAGTWLGVERGRTTRRAAVYAALAEAGLLREQAPEV